MKNINIFYNKYIKIIIHNMGKSSGSSNPNELSGDYHIWNYNDSLDNLWDDNYFWRSTNQIHP